MCWVHKVWRDREGKKRKIVDAAAAAAAAANQEWMGLNLRRMNWGGLNHVTYYEAEEKKRRGSEKRAEQRAGNIMDKGSNEAERWQEKGEEDRGRRQGRKGGMKRRARCRVKEQERRRPRGGKRGNVPHCQLFSHSACARTPDGGCVREMGERGTRDRGREKSGAAEEERAVAARPLWKCEGIVS